MYLVSIIIPTYNSQNYILETIDSALGQLYIDVEIIVVDDGSTDKTKEYLQLHGVMDKIKYIYQSNKGLSSARNTGLVEAAGEYCCFLDSDDLLEPTFCYELAIYMNVNKKDIVYSDYSYFLDDNEKTIVNIHYPIISGDIFNQIIFGNKFPVNAVMIRKRIINNIIFDVELTSYEDWFFWIRLSLNHSFFYYNKVLAKVRIRQGSMSTNKRKMIRNCVKVLEKTEPLVKKRGISDKELALFYYFYSSCLISDKKYIKALKRCYMANLIEFMLVKNIKIFVKIIYQSLRSLVGIK